MGRRVAVIGAGPAGIAAVKSCVEEGLDVVCFERKQRIGGIWNTNEGSCVPYSTVTYNSKEFMSFSDFPAAEYFSNYFLPDTLLQYLEQYAAHFGLDKHIRCCHSIMNVERSKASKPDCPPCWDVQYVDENGRPSTTVFDFVLVCTGFYGKPYVPPAFAEALASFTGQVTHSSKYRSWKGYEDKRVIVSGLGNSGGDISCEVSRVAKQVWLSTKRGGFCQGRLSHAGVPVDLNLMSRFVNCLPTPVQRKLISTLCNIDMDHTLYGLQPDPDSFNGSITVLNDELKNRIVTGQVQVKNSISHCRDKTVTFSDGSSVEADDIILCTGFGMNYPFLSEDILQLSAGKKYIPAYKKIFPIGGEGSFGVIGGFRYLGPNFTVFELQARYAAMVFAGKVSLPSRPEMQLSVDEDFTRAQKKHGPDVRKYMEIQPIVYSDELAHEIGVSVDIRRLLINDPRMAYRLIFGPSVAYQYRLFGPGKWPGARDAIMKLNERMTYPLKTRTLEFTKQTCSRSLLGTIIVVLTVLFAVVWWFN